MRPLVIDSFASIQAPHHAQWSRDDELVPITSASRRAGPILYSKHRCGRKYHHTRQAHLKVRRVCDVAGSIFIHQLDFVKDLRARRVIFQDIEVHIGFGRTGNAGAQSRGFRGKLLAPDHLENQFTHDHWADRRTLLNRMGPQHAAEVARLDDAARTQTYRGEVKAAGHGHASNGPQRLTASAAPANCVLRPRSGRTLIRHRGPFSRGVSA